ncbi:hypothetical protein, partial [Acinetobacter baumannii]|uniref:hypothetical protein n=1 Tax=Acinetobacter baumannii TaxID=470 RepID=UPI001C456768
YQSILKNVTDNLAMTDLEICLGNLTKLTLLNDYSVWFGFLLGFLICLFILIMIERFKNSGITKQEL